VVSWPRFSQRAHGKSASDMLAGSAADPSFGGFGIGASPLALSPSPDAVAFGRSAADAAHAAAAGVEEVAVPSLDASAAVKDSLVTAAADGVDAGAVVAALEPLGWWPGHLVMQGVEALHVASGLPYWATIVVITLGLRTAMLPLAFGTMRNSARMAVMKPEMELVTERMKLDPNSNVRARD